MQASIFFGLGSFQCDTLLQNQLGPVGPAVLLHAVGCGFPNLACEKQRSASLTTGDIKSVSSFPFACDKGPAGQGKGSPKQQVKIPPGPCQSTA